jgi:hypothetical protein
MMDGFGEGFSMDSVRLLILFLAIGSALGLGCPRGEGAADAGSKKAAEQAAGQKTEKEAERKGQAMSFRISSPAFAGNEKIPLRYSGDGEDISPPLVWGNVPKGTAELALICDDPDAPTAQPFVHWVIYGLSPELKGLPEAVPTQAELTEPVKARQGENSWGNTGYGGPAPPRHRGVHHYRFTLYALSKRLDLPAGADKERLLKAAEGSVPAKTTLTGLYER